MFDAVTAVETHYYWPDLASDIKEVLRVLKPGGTLSIVAEACKGGKGGKYDRVIQSVKESEGREILNYLTASEHGELLTNAGYEEVRVFEKYEKGWLSVVGRKHEV